MRLSFPWAKDRTQEELENIAETILETRLGNLVDNVETLLANTDELSKLKQEIETLRIEKSRREEEYARIERELIHKIGLEKNRQIVELIQAKRDAILTVREEQLIVERKRNEDQLKFYSDRFTAEVGYMKGLLDQLLAQLPKTSLIFKKEESNRG